MQRYIQQIAVAEMGIEGQSKITAATVLIIGAGGLGTPVAAYLAAAGVGSIGLIDADKIALSNLSRQFMYSETEIGKAKVTVLSSKLNTQNPGIKVHSYEEMLTETNAEEYISSYDIVCDCTDNAATRVLIDKFCGQKQKPLVYAAVKDWQGQVTVLHHTQKISLQDIFSLRSMMENGTDNCSIAGIINSTCGIAGSIQGTEVLKIILGLQSKLDGGVLVFDTKEASFKVFQLYKKSEAFIAFEFGETNKIT